MTVAVENVTGDVVNAVTGTGASDPWVLVVAFVGAVIGVSYRTIYPYLERAREEEDRKKSHALLRQLTSSQWVLPFCWQ